MTLILEAASLRIFPLRSSDTHTTGSRSSLTPLESALNCFEASPDASEFLLFHASKETIETPVDPHNEDTSPILKSLIFWFPFWLNSWRRLSTTLSAAPSTTLVLMA